MADEFSRSGDTRPATIDDLYAAMVDANDIVGEQRRRIAELEARVSELQDALRPFARMAALNVIDGADDGDGCSIVMSNREMRRALAAMPHKVEVSIQEAR